MAWAAWMITASLPYWPVNPQLAGNPWFIFQLDVARCLWAILPAPLLWGASFPLALAAVSPRGQDPGRLVGGIYAANTVGAIVGALSFSLLLIPLVGTQAVQQVLIVIVRRFRAGGAGAVARRRSPPAGPAQEAPLGAAGAVVMTGALAAGGFAGVERGRRCRGEWWLMGVSWRLYGDAVRAGHCQARRMSPAEAAVRPPIANMWGRG